MLTGLLTSTPIGNLTRQFDWQQLANKALAGDPLTRLESLAVLAAPDAVMLDQLAAAHRVRRHYWGNRVRLHFLLNAQSGLCPKTVTIVPNRKYQRQRLKNIR